jgi:hypothetical protein
MSTCKDSEKQTPGLIYQKIADIFKEIPSIGKDRVNSFGNFNFRGIDDICNCLHPLFAKHQVFIMAKVRESINSVEKNNVHYTTLFIDYTLYAPDGSYVSGCGVAKDTGDKVTGKCMSYALKYFLTEMFLIPTGEPDPDSYKPIPTNESVNVQPQNNSYREQKPMQSFDPSKMRNEPISAAQVKLLWARCKGKSITPEDVATKFGFNTASSITKPKMNEILEFIGTYGNSNANIENGTGNHYPVGDNSEDYYKQ